MSGQFHATIRSFAIMVPNIKTQRRSINYLQLKFSKCRVHHRRLCPTPDPRFLRRYIATDLAQQVLSNAPYKQAVLDRTPMGRVGEPKEVAGAAHSALYLHDESQGLVRAN